MNDSKISVRVFQKALFQSALDKNLLDKVSNDMQYIAEVCRIPEFRELLHSPIVGRIKSKPFMTSSQKMWKRSPCHLSIWLSGTAGNVISLLWQESLIPIP